MEFYKKWNTLWREYVKKNRIKAIYKCTPKQVNFLNEALILDIYHDIDDSGYYFEITFDYGGKKVAFRKVFDLMEHRHYWHLNDYLYTDYFEDLFESFPFEDMLNEWSEMKREAKKMDL